MSAGPAPTYDKFLQGHDYLLHVYILSNFMQFSKYFQAAPPLLPGHSPALTGPAEAIIAMESGEYRLEIHKDVIG